MTISEVSTSSAVINTLFQPPFQGATKQRAILPHPINNRDDINIAATLGNFTGVVVRD